MLILRQRKRYLSSIHSYSQAAPCKRRAWSFCYNHPRERKERDGLGANPSSRGQGSVDRSRRDAAGMSCTCCHGSGEILHEDPWERRDAVALGTSPAAGKGAKTSQRL